jgi:hypothetical protein
MKTSELTGAALDWAVGRANSQIGQVELTNERGDWLPIFRHKSRGATGGGNLPPWEFYYPSIDWSHGGPIIEREKISVEYRDTFGWWVAYINGGTDDEYGCTGQTPLIAAMRCYVASKMGDTVELPKELQC